MSAQSKTTCGEEAALRPQKTRLAVGKALLTVLLGLTLAACSALPAPTPAPSKTAKARATRTHRPTKTARPTKTLQAFVSATPPSAPPLTPTLLLLASSSTPPPTVSLASPTPTPQPPGELDCNLVWQSPPNGARYGAGIQFSAGWKIKNAGTATWEPGSFEFVYLGGFKLGRGDRFPLDTSVPPGQSIVLSVPMRSPVNPGVYTTHWGIRQADAYFCRLTLTIWVR